MFGRSVHRPDRSLSAALDLLLGGDESGLALALDRERDLVGLRASSTRAPYDGYFHGATLLHHVAGNPFVSPLPAGIVAMTRLLLERGADVDAVTLQGPGQPDDIGWTTLGLVATSSVAREAGHQAALMELLIGAGADVDARAGGCIMGALYYGESEAAERLARNGAMLDLAAAAGVGDIGRLSEILNDEARLEAALLARPGSPGSIADRLAHYSRVPWPATPDLQDVLGLALAYAALHGRVEALRLLLDAGADPNHRPPFDSRATALHRAAMGDHADAVRLLVEAGADPRLRDLEHHATPLRWAAYLGRTGALEALKAVDG